MKAPLQPREESHRLAELEEYRILDTPSDDALNDLTALAAQICGTPISLISLIDQRRQWFKSRVGFALTETPRDVSFCGHAILQPGVFVVPDTAEDERFADNPLVATSPGIRFYAGAPLLTPTGQALGTLCVMDHVPRQLSLPQQHALQVLSRQAMSQLELRRQARALIGSERRLRTIVENEPECVKVLGLDGTLLEMNAAGLRMIEADSLDQIFGKSILALILPEHRAAFVDLSRRVKAGESGTLTFEIQGLKGTRRWLATHAAPLRDETGAIVSLLGVTRDITDHRRTEAALRQGRQRLRDLIDGLGPSIFVGLLTPEGTLIDANRSALAATGLRSEDAIGQPFDALPPWTHSPAVKRQLREAIDRAAHGEPSRYDVRIRAGNGQFIDLDFSLQPIQGEAGKVTFLVPSASVITERTQAEDELRRSEASLANAQRIANIGNWELDIPGQTLSWSDQIYEMFGVTKGQFGATYEAFMERVHPEDRGRMGEAQRAALAGTGRLDLEHRIVRPDGTVRTVRELGELTRNPAGQPIHLTGTVQDITERKHAEMRIQHLNRIYAVLSDINQTIVREANPQAMLTAACRIAIGRGQFRMAWIGLTGATNGDVNIAAHAGATPDTLGLLDTLLGDGTREGSCTFTQRALRTGHHGVCNDIARDPEADSWRAAALQRNYRAMASMPLKTGERVLGAFNLYADEPGVFDDAELRLLDELAANIAFALDVHANTVERQRVDQALRDSEERFRQLAENIQEVFWMTDPVTAQVLYVSPAYETIWGRTCASLYAAPQTWLEAIHPEDLARIAEAAVQKQVRGDYDEVYRIVRPDGSVRWIHDRAFPIRSPAGDIHRLVGTAEDISEEKRLEEQFRQAQKMEAIGQLAGGVAHDFNNLLTVIQGYGSLLRLGDQNADEVAEAAQQIVEASERAANLTRQLLAFSRRQVMHRQGLDLNEVVTHVAKMLQRIVTEEVRLQLNLHPRPLLVHADAGMLDQVLLNLVVNARDAMPGGGQLFISTSQRELGEEAARAIPQGLPGRYACLRVTDTGSGIAQEHLSHIFEPFFTTKEPGKGTGLGLATAFGIIAQHGGMVQVESQLGNGTTFEILLPATEDAPELRTAEVPEPQLPAGAETILVVEDELSVRLLTRVVLQRAGYRVLEASDGVDASRVWNQYADKIHLLLTDLVMPHGVGGRELAARLQAMNRTLRVIFTSGYSAEVAGRDLPLLDRENFIQKPFSPQQLLETVRRSLDS